MSDFLWKEELCQLPDTTSQLLYLLYKLNQLEEINIEEKQKLKKHIFEKNEILLDLFKKLLKTNNLKSFISSVKLIFLDDINPCSKSIVFKALVNVLKTNEISINSKSNNNNILKSHSN